MSKTARPSRSPDAARRRPSRSARNQRVGNQRARKQASQPSLAAHRLFPGLVALWFAALFGLGALVAGAGALASLVVSLHLPAILPAAAPPLGMTARLLVAIALAGGGGVFGLLLGQVLRRRVTGPRPVEVDAFDADPFEADAFDSESAEDPHFAEPAPEPAPAPVAPGRRRAFSAAALREEEAAPKVRARDAHPDAPPRRPLVVTEDVAPFADLPFAAPVVDAAQSEWEPEPAPAVEPDPMPVAVASVAPEADSVSVSVPASASESVRAPEPPRVAPAPLAALAVTAPQVPLEEAHLDSLGLVQLIERLARAIATRQDLRAAVKSDVPAPEALTSAPVLAEMPVIPETVVREAVSAAPEPTEPLLRTKPPRLARSADAPLLPSDPEAVPAPPAARPFDPLASFAPSPIDFGQALVDEDLVDDVPLAPRFLGDDVAEARYSSLTGATLARPDLGRFAIVNETPVSGQPAPRQIDPVVPFPVPPGRMTGRGEEPVAIPEASGVSDGEADRALREALATLRRMTARG